MLAFAVRGVVLLGVLSWYSATVWRMIDGYFKDQFRTYLHEEYRKHPRMRSDVENVGAVDKAQRVLPTESSYAEIYGLDAVCPVDTADTCPRAAASSEKAAAAATAEEVTGGSSENAAADTSSTDKNAFPKSATRSALESRKLPGGSGAHDEEQRSAAINQDGKEQEKTIEPPASAPGPAKSPRRRQGERKPAVSAEFSREKPAKRRVNTVLLTDLDLAGARISSNGHNDFSEFEDDDDDDDDDDDEGSRGRSTEGIPVSELPFKPKADIGGLDRVSAEEFCPLTLEDEASCGETTAWP